MPFRSTLSRSAGKLLGVFRQKDLDLRGAGQVKKELPFEATGGAQKLTPGDGYTYHFFTANGNFVTTSPGTVEYIIIGGGGAGSGQPGGNNYGGGGAGAGGVRTGNLTVAGGSNPVVIGATAAAYGPTHTPEPMYEGVMGNPSSAFGITAQGGGSGGGYNQSPADEYNGGSGGGSPAYSDPDRGLGSRQTGTTTPVPDTGNNGGQSAPAASGGGGGAGGVGGDAGPTAPEGGVGGIGIAFPGWTIPPSYGTPGPSGPLRYFAGGGGGGGNGSGGAGGYGGGGAGAATSAGGDGTANTGGGGGSVAGNGEHMGGDGGSGIVICRYQ